MILIQSYPGLKLPSLFHLLIGNVIVLETLRLAYEFLSRLIRLFCHTLDLVLLLLEQLIDSVVDWSHAV